MIVVEATELSGGFSAFLTAVMLAGALQLVFGLLRVGKLAAYIPSSVVNGMLAAIGLLLIMQQAPVALGTPASSIGLSGSLEAAQGSRIGPPLVALVSLALVVRLELQGPAALPARARIARAARRGGLGDRLFDRDGDLATGSLDCPGRAHRAARARLVRQFQ